MTQTAEITNGEAAHAPVVDPQAPASPAPPLDPAQTLADIDPEFKELAEILAKTGKRAPIIIRLDETNGSVWKKDLSAPLGCSPESEKNIGNTKIKSIWYKEEDDEYEILLQGVTNSQWEKNSAGLSVCIPAVNVTRVYKMWSLNDLGFWALQLTKASTWSYLESAGVIDADDDEDNAGDGAAEGEEEDDVNPLATSGVLWRRLPSPTEYR